MFACTVKTCSRNLPSISGIQAIYVNIINYVKPNIYRALYREICVRGVSFG